jgi:hypothetical protein
MMSIKVAFKVNVVATVVSPPNLYGKVKIIGAIFKESDAKSSQLKLSCSIDTMISGWISVQRVTKTGIKEENSRNPTLLTAGTIVPSSIETGRPLRAGKVVCYKEPLVQSTGIIGVGTVAQATVESRSLAGKGGSTHCKSEKLH